MNKIIALVFFCLLFQTSQGQDRLYKILKDYIPYLPFEKKTDSLPLYYVSNKDFKTDSASGRYLKGVLENFNPPAFRPSKTVIEIAADDNDNSLSYAVRICLDSTLQSKQLLQSETEKLRNKIVNFFSKEIPDESLKKDKHPYKTYNFYAAGSTFPAAVIGWGYNESKTFTGYYFFVSLFLGIEK